jgi:major membrane immunogen (membrane-anchored lipoprotein)
MTTRVIIVALTVLAYVAGCGGSKTSGGSSSATQQAPQSQQQTPAGLVVDITISNGAVTPANAEFEAKVGQPITFRVTSDAADELHVHSVPDHEFEVAARPNQPFQFSVDVPGQVEVELHKLDRTVATIQVQQ